MNRIGGFLAALFLVTLASLGASAQNLPKVIPPEPVDHPRLFLGKGEEDNVRAALGCSPILASSDSVIMAYCDSVLLEKPVERVLTGRRLLGVAKEAIKRVFYLSYAYRIHGDEKYARRAIEEMMAASLFPDWNPSHFLDTAEMAFALGIGYDWLYDLLSDNEKDIISAAVVNKAFIPSKDEDGVAWFYSSPINWNQVCNGGLVCAALAIMDEHPGEASRIVMKALETNPLSLRESYSPEGCYAEGYNYWGYGSTYEILLVAALESSFGTDCRLLEEGQGFLRSGRFMQMMKTPSLGCYNFSDSNPTGTVQYMLSWLTAKTADTSLLRQEIDKIKEKGFGELCEERFFPFFIVNASTLKDPRTEERLDLDDLPSSTDNFYESTGATPLFIYRSGWGRKASYLGVKGGKASSSHGHCDIGSFFFESDGVTWADDLGMQNYNSLESLGMDIWNMKQNSDRWKVFRMGPFSHNIITVNGHIPDVDVYCGIMETWKDRSSRKGAALNLGLLYQEDLSSYRRDIYLDEKEVLHVKDSLVNGDRKSIIRWQMCTKTSAKIKDGSIVLGSDVAKILAGKVRTADGKSPTLTPFVEPTPANSYDAPNPEHLMVGFEMELEKGQEAVLDIMLGEEPNP